MKRYIAMLLVFLLMVPCMAQAELDLQLVIKQFDTKQPIDINQRLVASGI